MVSCKPRDKKIGEMALMHQAPGLEPWHHAEPDLSFQGHPNMLCPLLAILGMCLSLHSMSFYSPNLGHPDRFSGDAEHPRWHLRECGVGQRPEAADYFNPWPEAFELYPPAHYLHQHSVPAPQGGHGWEPVLRWKMLMEPKSATWPSQSLPYAGSLPAFKSLLLFLFLSLDT